MEKEKLKKILTKAVDFEQGKEIALAKEFISLDEKIDADFSEANTKIEDTKSELESKIENIQLLKGDTGEKGADGRDGKDGEDGKDGTNGLNGKDGRDGKDGKDGADGLDGLNGENGKDGRDGSPDTPKEIVTKLESLKGKERLDKSAIKGLEDLEYQIKNIHWGGGISQVYHDETLTGLGTQASPLSASGGDLTGYVPYIGATQDLNLGNFYLQADGFRANDSGGAYIKSNNGTNVALFGAGGGANWTFYDGVNYDSATANTLAYFGGSKTLSSVTLGSGLSLSGGTLTNTGLTALSTPLATMEISGGAIDFNGNSFLKYALQSEYEYELSADVNDLSIEYHSVVFVSPTSSGFKITGVVANTKVGALLLIVNKTDAEFILENDSASSAVENRFILPSLSDMTIGDHEGAFFVYDILAKVWRCVGKLGGSSSLPSLSNTRVWIGNASNVATEQTIVGDVTLANTGAVTIANNAVTFAKMQAITDGNLLGASGGTAVEQITPDTNYFSMASNTLGLKTNASSGEVLYQGASALDGASNLKIDSNGNANIQENGTVASPSNGVTLFTKSNLGRRMLAQQDVSGDSYRYQPSVYDYTERYMQALGGNTSTVYNLGITSGVTGSSAAVALGTGSYFAQINRLALNASAASGSSATNRNNGLIVYRGNASGRGGFHFMSRGGVGSAASNATLRWWTGLYGTNSTIGNVEPDTLLNMVGFGINAGETTIRFYTNDGSGTASRTDLGANFPANALSTDMYTFEIWCAPNASEIFWRCTRENTGDVASGSVTSDLPTNTVFMHPQVWINTGTTATAVSWHFNKMAVSSKN